MNDYSIGEGIGVTVMNNRRTGLGFWPPGRRQNDRALEYSRAATLMHGGWGNRTGTLALREGGGIGRREGWPRNVV